MNELKIFSNEKFGTVRTVIKNNEPWFVAADVCKALEIGDTWNAVNRLDSDEKGTDSISTLGGTQEMTVVNEPGLYSLVLGSRKPEAKEFKRWITHEVIPSIRKHGAYMTEDTLARAIADPREAAKILIALADEREKNARLETENSALRVENQMMLPKSEYFDSLVERNLLTNFRTTAQEFGMTQKDFIKFLIDKKFIYRDARHGTLKPYASKNNGYFEVKEFSNDKTGHVGTQTLITPKGREAFRLMVQGL